MPFNEGQLKAIQQRDASILVSAPAGSGKTKILVSRIVELLKEHEVVPVCPEMLGGLSCPRIPCEKVGDKIMDKEKAKALSKTLACYKELQENNSVNLIEFHTADGQKHGIGNPEAIKLLLSVAVIELERQLRTAQFGDIPESLENSREYKAAKQLEYAMNDLGFKSERFAQALPYFHKTLEQTFFRTVKASITAMAGRDSRCIDDRNRASYEMCQMLASMLEDTRLPFI